MYDILSKNVICYILLKMIIFVKKIIKNYFILNYVHSCSKCLNFSNPMITTLDTYVGSFIGDCQQYSGLKTLYIYFMINSLCLVNGKKKSSVVGKTNSSDFWFFVSRYYVNSDCVRFSANTVIYIWETRILFW